MLSLLLDFRGRLRRRDFWRYGLIVWLAAIALTVLGGWLFPVFSSLRPGQGRAVAALSLAPLIFWSSLALLAKRFHDRDRPMWDMLYVLTPIRGWLWGIVECCSEGTPGPNRFGPSPKPMVDPADYF